MERGKLERVFGSDFMNKSVFGKFYSCLIGMLCFLGALEIMVAGDPDSLESGGAVIFFVPALVLWFIGFWYNDRQIHRRERKK